MKNQYDQTSQVIVTIAASQEPVSQRPHPLCEKHLSSNDIAILLRKIGEKHNAKKLSAALPGSSGLFSEPTTAVSSAPSASK